MVLSPFFWGRTFFISGGFKISKVSRFQQIQAFRETLNFERLKSRTLSKKTFFGLFCRFSALSNFTLRLVRVACTEEAWKPKMLI